MTVALLFLDIETLGVSREAAIWEVAATRFEDGQMVASGTWFVHHDPGDRDPDYPEAFAADYRKRYDPWSSTDAGVVLGNLANMAVDRAIVCGSNPRFDMDKLEAVAAERGVPAPGWHYHPYDLPVMVHGYLHGKGITPAPPWRSDFLSQAVGIDPRMYERHTAAGDVWWCRDLWTKIGGV